MSSTYTIYQGYVWWEYGTNKLLLTLSGVASGTLQAANSTLDILCWTTDLGYRSIPVVPILYRQKADGQTGLLAVLPAETDHPSEQRR
jgi:hypothetical protein